MRLILITLFLSFSFKAHSLSMPAPGPGQGMCIQCMYNYNSVYGPQRPFFPMQMSSYPWWANYGNLRYSNWNYPGSWNHGNWRMNPRPYPGGGGAVAMKPNIYLEGKADQAFKVQLEFEKGANLLIASPQLSEWSGVIQGESLKTEKARYPYLYYDFRFDENVLQREAGFCGPVNNIMNEMINILQASGFKKREVKDFAEFWPMKLPKGEVYCVYPQEDEQLKKQVKISVEPKNASITRINFLIDIYRTIENYEEKKVITKKWKKNSQSESGSDIRLREWGVIFTTN